MAAKAAAVDMRYRRHYAANKTAVYKFVAAMNSFYSARTFNRESTELEIAPLVGVREKNET